MLHFQFVQVAPVLQNAAAWRYITTEYGAQCVTMGGTSKTLMLCVVCWDIDLPFKPAAAASMVEGQGRYGLVGYTVLDERTLYLTARTEDGMFTAVDTIKMLVFFVPIAQVAVRGIHVNLL